MLDDRAIQGLIGRSLAGYQVTRFVGARPVGDVFDGVEEATGQPVVVSVAPVPSGDGQAGARTDSRAAAGLRHPNIAPTLAGGSDGPLAYIIQPRVAGETLAERLRRGLPADLAARGEVVAEIVPQVGGALVYAHAANVTHGALSPDTVILTPDGRAVVSDFVRAAPDADGLLPPAYLAPEQRGGAGGAAPAADQYALAAITYATLTGRLHTATQDDNDMPLAVATVLRKALSSDPANRYDGVASFLGGLLLALDTLPAAGTATPLGVGAGAAAATPLPPAQPASAPAAARARSSPTRMVIAGAVVVALLAGASGLTWLALSGARQGAPATASLTTAPTAAVAALAVTPSPAPTSPALAAAVATTAPTPTTAPPSPTPISSPTARPAPAVTVGAPTPAATVSTGPFGGEWYHNFGQMRLMQTGSRVSGTYNNAFTGASGFIEGSVAGNGFTGQWTSRGASGPIEWRASPDNQTFDGILRGDADNRWCGARPGIAFPEGCSFAGAWINRVIDRSDCPMTLRRVNLTVTGTYCNGSISGVITFAPGAPVTLLDGTWTVSGSPPGAFRLYLLGYDGRQFQGNWMGDGPNQWCGWRAGAPEPSPCLRN